MRLLFSAAFDTRAVVGISLYIQRLVPELARLCDLTVLTPDKEAFCGIARTIRIPGWTRSHVGRVVWTMSSLPWYCGSDFDAVLCPTPVVPIVSSIPVVAVVHDLTPLILHRCHASEHKAIFWLALQTLRQADAAITVSGHTRMDLTTRFCLLPSARVCVVPEGPGVLPTYGVSPIPAPFEPYVLYVGGHARHKNLPRLVAAFARLPQPSDLRLVITGWSKPELAALTNAAVRRYGLHDRVVIISKALSQAELSGLYARCAAFVYPSLYEGFGLPVLEALAHGAPVACSRSSSLPEVAGDAALYFDPLSIESIAEALRIVTGDVETSAELRRRGPERARSFSWQRTAFETYRVLQRLATDSGRGRSTLPRPR